MTERIRVFLVDDHRMMRDGLRQFLAGQAGIEVVGEAGDGREVIDAVRNDPPDVVVMDVSMPGLNGIEATRQVLRENPEVRVVALSTYADRRYVRDMFRAGARGYVLKLAAAHELVHAVRVVQHGDCYTSPEIDRSLVDASLDCGPALAPREREVLQLLAEGRTSPQIGARLSISSRTVEAHRRNIMGKLGLRTIAELTKYAVREGLTPLDQ